MGLAAVIIVNTVLSIVKIRFAIHRHSLKRYICSFSKSVYCNRFEGFHVKDIFFPYGDIG